MRRVVCVLAASLVLAISCARTEPKIPFGFLELVYYQEAERPSERFSFFIIAEDEDGIENLGDLYLFHDREQLRWHIPGDSWIQYSEGGTTWIGSRAIAIGSGERLPRGQYRAVLVSKGGERGERLLSFDAPQDPVFPFPTLSVQAGRYTVESLYPLNSLLFYDGRGNFLATVSLSNLAGLIRDLNVPSDAQLVALWAQDAQRFTSAMTNVTAIY